ncbi:hypothetical protein CYMTET_36829 [Cymbomonas tetramitiformis]|uniref:Ketoreductase domain-containing protein n=1 Tax=Cymbomonas tetramitiformis TaxID=36881 RepID=A0AAE0F6L4_9CHLO|nr:hypothetical protein CYMTET_36829 [Cymbomonas tetramitiformis]
MADLFSNFIPNRGQEETKPNNHSKRRVNAPLLVLAGGVLARVVGRCLRRKNDIEGDIILITGASRGIGARLAEGFAREKCKLCLAARNEVELQKVAAACRLAGASAVICVVADVQEVAALVSLVEECKSKLGAPQVLINNAGVEFINKHHEVEPEQLSTLSDVNFRAPMILSRLVLPDMLLGKKGVICNISSFAGFSALPLWASYGASKWGLNAFTLALRAELRGTGVSCFSVCPGFVTECGMAYDLLDMKKPKRGQRMSTTNIAKLVNTVVAHVRMNGPNPLVTPVPLPAVPLAILNLVFPCTTPVLLEAGNPISAEIRDTVEKRSQGASLPAEDKLQKVGDWDVVDAGESSL